MNKLLVISPGSIGQTLKKGTKHQLLEFTCNNYFEKVIFWNFNLPEDQHVVLSDAVEIVETGKKFNVKILDLFYYLFIGYELIKKNKFTFIRSTDPFIRGLIGWILTRFFKIPFCISIHADYDKRKELEGKNNEFAILGSWKISKWLELFTIKHADMILPIRESLKQKYVAQGIDETKIRVIPHGIDILKFLSQRHIDIYDKFNIAKSKKIISVVCRLKKENYIYDIVAIAENLKNRNYKNIIFIIAGNGEEYNNLNNLIIKKDLQDLIKLIGFQSSETIASIRKSSYINLSLMGGFSLIESCASGRPVISYDVEWHYELVKNNITGFLVTEKDVEEIVEKIIFLLDNSELANEMGENAKKLALENHELLSSDKVKIKCYEELLKIKNK